MAPHPDRGGFTLAELLIALAVMSLLAGMLMPVLGLARRGSEKAGTAALVRKVDAALRLFKTDTRVYPWDGHLQPLRLHDGSPNPAFDAAYPDILGDGWTNRLGHHLGGRPAGTALDAVLADADAAARAFDYDLTNADGSIASPLQEVPSRYAVHAFLASDALPKSFTYAAGGWSAVYDDATALAATLNRMAQERYAHAAVAGALRLTGPRVAGAVSPSGAVFASANPRAAERAATRILPSPASAGCPGWGDDYLRGELSPRERQGEAIVDVWGRPLVYICQVLPGCQAAGRISPFKRGSIGLLDEAAYGLGPAGRRALVPGLPADGAALPEPGNLLHADVRRYAAPACVHEFELRSAGPDGRWGWMRDDPANADDIAAHDHRGGLR